MIWKPTTKLGVGALICAVLAVLSYGAIMASMASPLVFGVVLSPGI